MYGILRGALKGLVMGIMCLMMLTTAFAQSTGTITGTVIVSGGTPPAGVITYTSVDGTMSGSVRVDSATGAYTLTGLPFHVPVFIGFEPDGDNLLGREWYPDRPTPNGATPFILTPEAPTITDINMNIEAAGSISGVVYDTDEETPLSGVLVLIDGYRFGTCTDAAGRYTLGELAFNLEGYRLAVGGSGPCTRNVTRTWFGDTPSPNRGTPLSITGVTRILTDINITIGKAVEVPSVPLFFMDTTLGHAVLKFDDDPRAEYINVFIGNPDFTIVHFEWYDLSRATCSAGACTLILDTYLENGSYLAYLQTWGNGDYNNGGELSWGGPHYFTVNAPPGGLITNPAASLSGGTFALTWTIAPSATWYEVWLGTGEPEFASVVNRWHFVYDICSGLVCTLPIDATLTSGTSYVWYVRTWGPGGISTNGLDGTGWVQGTTFVAP